MTKALAAGVAILLLLIVSIPALGQIPASQSGAVRSIAGAEVSIQITPPAETSVWGYEEVLPEGLTPEDITGSNGTWNATTRKITWYATSANPATVGYRTAGADGTYTVSGAVNFDGVDGTMTGPAQISIGQPQSHTVTPSAGANGSITPSVPQTVAHGATTQFTVTPDQGYTASVTGTCGGTLVGTIYTTNPITANCTVTAAFLSAQSGAVRSIAGAEVSIQITPPTETSVWGYEEILPQGLTPEDITGSNGTWNATTRKITWYATSANPATVGYRATGADGTYTVSGAVNFDGVDGAVTGPTQISIGQPQSHTVTPSAGANGSITPSVPQTVAHGATTQFTVTPDQGYTASVTGTCGGILVGSTYTTNPITRNCTVIASFRQGEKTKRTLPGVLMLLLDEE